MLKIIQEVKHKGRLCMSANVTVESKKLKEKIGSIQDAQNLVNLALLN